MSQTSPSPGQGFPRWTAKMKAAFVLDLFWSSSSVADVASKHGLTASELEQWKDDFLTHGTEALRNHSQERETPSDVEQQLLQAQIGELAKSLEVLKKASLPQ